MSRILHSSTKILTFNVFSYVAVYPPRDGALAIYKYPFPPLRSISLEHFPLSIIYIIFICNIHYNFQESIIGEIYIFMAKVNLRVAFLVPVYFTNNVHYLTSFFCIKQGLTHAVALLTLTITCIHPFQCAVSTAPACLYSVAQFEFSCYQTKPPSTPATFI